MFLEKLSKKLFIIIITYNGARWIRKCLDSCMGYNVIVIDNNSSDRTVDIISKHFPNIKILKQENNLGFGAANNLGFEYALKNGADYVFLLNQDAYLEKNAIANLINAHLVNPEFGILSPLHFNGKGNSFDRKFSYSVSYDNNTSFYFDAVNNKLKDIYEVPFVNAAGWLIPKTTLELIGGFDPIFFHYGEDDNYCQRVIYNKLKIGVVPNAIMFHDRIPNYYKPKLFSKSYFLDAEKTYKQVLADINTNNEEQIALYRNKIYKYILVGIIKFDINAVRGFVKELKILNRSYQESNISRRINASSKGNYLNLE